MALGLNMLLIASEELATPREDLPAQRREQLSKLLGAQVPQVREGAESTQKAQGDPSG